MRIFEGAILRTTRVNMMCLILVQEYALFQKLYTKNIQKSTKKLILICIFSYFLVKCKGISFVFFSMNPHTTSEASESPETREQTQETVTLDTKRRAFRTLIDTEVRSLYEDVTTRPVLR